MHRTLIAAGLGLSMLLWLPAAAQQPPAASTPPATSEAADEQPLEGRGRGGRGALAACRGDIAALCAGVERGRKNRITCLKANESKLSPACTAAIQAAMDGRPGRGREGGAARDEGGRPGRGIGRLATCQSDLATLCAGIEPGKGGRVKCLRENQARLSPDCAQSLQATTEGRKELRQACATERQTICSKSGAGNGGFVGCLKQNATNLSEACGRALANVREGDVRSRRRAGNHADTGGAAPSSPPLPR